jgi:3-keto-5-aminohexanoate cleavage enzyme
MKSKELMQENTISWEPLNWMEEEKLSMPKKLVILTAAPGATVAKAQNPYLPITHQEIVKNHVEAYKAGASVFHVHARDEKGHPTGDPQLHKRIILELKEKCPDAIIDCSFAYPFSEDSVEARLEPICKLDLPIELGTMSAGTMNIMGRWVYINREDYLKAAVKYLQERKIRPTITVYNVKQIEEVKKWAMKTGLVKKPYLNLSLGLFGDPARSDVLKTWLKYLPEGCDWVAETAGRNWLPTTIEAILSGGHIMRAGMEDGIYMYPHRDDLIKSSAEAVEKVRNIAEELGLEIATPDEARKILGLIEIW